MPEFEYKQRPFDRSVTDEAYDIAVGKIPAPRYFHLDLHLDKHSAKYKGSVCILEAHADPCTCGAKRGA